MKSRIVLRAEFQQPKESTMKLSAAVAVEIYHAKIGPPAEWRARRPGTTVISSGSPRNRPRKS